MSSVAWTFWEKNFVFRISSDGSIYFNSTIEFADDIDPAVLRKHVKSGRFIFGKYIDIKGAGASIANNKNTIYFNGDPNLLFDLFKKIIGEELVLYSGAGLSKAASIPTQRDLEESLFIDNPRKLCWYIVYKPNYLVAQFKMFNERIRIAKPTKAHKNIALFTKKKNCILVTENVDWLHEKTGIMPKNPFKDKSLFDLKPSIVVMIGVGYPQKQDLIRHWYDMGAEYHIISLEKPHLYIEKATWYGLDIQDFIGSPEFERSVNRV